MLAAGIPVRAYFEDAQRHLRSFSPRLDPAITARSFINHPCRLLVLTRHVALSAIRHLERSTAKLGSPILYTVILSESGAIAEDEVEGSNNADIYCKFAFI